MITNADITLYNKVYDKANRTEKFIPTFIFGVSLYAETGSSVGAGQQIKAPGSAVRIPKGAYTSGKEYVNALEYKALEDTSDVWTIQLGDIVVTEITDGETVTNEAELRKSYDGVFMVKEYSDNTIRGSERVKHWRIGGV